jgi:uncharacterized protein YndB with AHSA1/START domain
MRKNKFKLEYQLNNASPHILWNSIGTAYGLSEWFADAVTEDNGHYIFRWNDHEQQATLLHARPNAYIRLQWEEDKGTEAFFELKIVTSELSRDLILQITDFADPAETEDMTLLWNQQVDELKRVTGM